MFTAADYIRTLLEKDVYARAITCHKVLEEEPARLGRVARPYPRAIGEVLERMGVASLYSHQARAMDAIRAGRDVVVTTPTASGKTLVYNLPFLERRLLDPDATALYIFPLKALAQDQKKTLESLTLGWPEHARPRVELYDGDTEPAARTRIRKNPPAVLVTNPEMLHLGILPWHERWTTFLASLSLIVLDEAHIYRGVFGAHMACLLQRLERVCARYNAHPVRVLCTATLGNPGQLGQLLLGLDQEPLVVSESGAPRGKRHMLFMDPETSASTLAISLLKDALDKKLRTIVYCRSRRMTELVSLWVSQQERSLARRISAYRAGYLPEERRDIEARMASGELLAVVSTSALELGIDIGALDVCILVGYPGSVMSTLQRGGRVGRKGQESCVVLIGSEDALDQYFVHNPEEFFARPPERAMLNPDNPVILARHLECAAAESPLRLSEKWLLRDNVRALAKELAREGKLLVRDTGQEYLAARKRPQRDVSLRGSGASFQIVDEAGRIIGSVDAHQAFRETHEGAVYIHRGRSYIIRKLDIGARMAWASPQRCHWHTNVRTQKTTQIMSTRLEGTVFGMPVYLGTLKVTELITGFERRENASRRLLDIQPLDMPPQIFETEGLWMCIPEAARLACEDKFYHFMGSIHALEHVSIGLMPLLVMADRNDFGGISIPMHPQIAGPAVFVYDGLPGGAGLCASAFTRLDELLVAVERTLEQCPCETGCPSCIQSPKCGSGNRPLDKQGALLLVRTILSGKNEGSTQNLVWKRCEKDPFALEEATTLPTGESLEGREKADGGEEACEKPGAQMFGTGCDLAGNDAGEGEADPQNGRAEGWPEGRNDDRMDGREKGWEGKPAQRKASATKAGFGPVPGPGQDLDSVADSAEDKGSWDAWPEFQDPARPSQDLQEQQESGTEACVQKTGSARHRQTKAKKARSGLARGGLMSLLTPSMLAGTGFCAEEVAGDEQRESEQEDVLDSFAIDAANDIANDIASDAQDTSAFRNRQAEEAPKPGQDPGQNPAPKVARKPRTYPGPVMVFDVETRYSAAEVGGWQNAARMGVSVCVCWDGSQYRAFAQEELGEMFALWKGAGLVVGFNSSRFDMHVLAPFAPYPLKNIPHLDILSEVYRYLHYRVSLDNLGAATLGCGKSGDGLKALKWWKEGRVDLIRSYCQMDVEITKGLWDFGRRHGYLLFANKAGQKVRVPVRW